MRFKDLVLGSNIFFSSRTDYKNALLRTQLALVTLLVSAAYLFIDFYHGVHGNEPYYLAAAALSVITVVLNRFQQYLMATVIFLLSINFFIFYFSLIDPYDSGVFMLFVVCSLMGFALLGFKYKVLAFMFIVLSLILFFISFWVDFDFIERRHYTFEYVQWSFTMNFLVTMICCIAIVYFMMDLHYHSRKSVLAKNEELKKANAELDRFVYSASHDLRAPLSSLLGLIEVAKLDPTGMDKYLEMMKTKINDLEDFIKDIISYSRNERMAVRREPVNVHEVVDEIVETLSFSEGGTDILVENMVPDDWVLMTDATRLKMVLSNLIDNALKYRDEDKLHPFVRVTAETKPGVQTITVQDNGVGIDKNYLERIFQMFFRASETSKGSGLGLYIVRETLIKINGEIHVESHLGVGTTFRLTFGY